MSAAYDPQNHFIDILLIATGPEPLAVPIGVDRALPYAPAPDQQRFRELKPTTLEALMKKPGLEHTDTNLTRREQTLKPATALPRFRDRSNILDARPGI